MRARLCFAVLFLDIPRQCLRRGLQESHHDVIASDTRALGCSPCCCDPRLAPMSRRLTGEKCCSGRLMTPNASFCQYRKNILSTNVCVRAQPLVLTPVLSPSLPLLGPAAAAGERRTRQANTAQVCGVRQSRSAGDSVQPLSCLIYLPWQRQRTECNFLRGGGRRWGW